MGTTGDSSKPHLHFEYINCEGQTIWFDYFDSAKITNGALIRSENVITTTNPPRFLDGRLAYPNGTVLKPADSSALNFGAIFVVEDGQLRGFSSLEHYKSWFPSDTYPIIHVGNWLLNEYSQTDPMSFRPGSVVTAKDGSDPTVYLIVYDNAGNPTKRPWSTLQEFDEQGYQRTQILYVDSSLLTETMLPTLPIDEVDAGGAGDEILPDYCYPESGGPWGLFEVPSTIVAGQTLGASVQFTHCGNADGGAFHGGFYISTDSVITTDDILVAEECFYASGVGVGVVGGCSTGNGTVPLALAGTTAYLGFIPDNRLEVLEIDEGNNAIASAPITITAPPASPPGVFTLSADALCFSGPSPEPNITLSWTDPTGASYVQIYGDGALLADGILGNGFATTNIVAGQEYTYFILAVNTAGTTQSNTITIAARADCDGGPPELISWEFNVDGDQEGWTTENTDATVVSAGLFRADPHSRDPQFISPEVSFEALSYRRIRFRMASNMQDGKGEIFLLGKGDSSFHKSRKIPFTVQNCSLCGNAEWYEYTV